MKSNPDFERIVFPAEFKLLRDGTYAGEGLVEGYANVFGNLDQNGDVVRPGAFKKTIQERVNRGLVPFLDSHQWDAAHTIGTVTEANEDQKGLRFRARMSNAPSAQEIRQKMLEGHIRRLSIGFTPVRESYERAEELSEGTPPGAVPSAVRRKSIVRHLHEVKLFEISAVPIAANEAATITSVKAAVPFQDLPLAEREHQWNAEEVRRRIAAWAGGGDEIANMNWARYRKAFLWYDRERADQVGAYKLPIADVIDNELVAVPRAIFAAAGSLEGARGDEDHARVDLGGDEEAVKANIERYYEKMARQFDDDSIVAPWRRKSLDTIVLEARALGRYNLQDIAAAATELLSLLSDGDRARLLEELCEATSSASALLHSTRGRHDGIAALRERASALGLNLARGRCE
jgi:HK97 family phage prohead protease